jgi:AsmA protein
MSRRGVIITVILLVVLLPLAAVATFVLSFNPNRYAPQVIAAVQRATGRQLVLGGPIGLQLSLTPSITVSDVSLANPPGFAAPELVTVNRISAQFRLLPLLTHHLDIIRLILDGPRITLQANKAGQADWDLAPPAPPAGTSPAPVETSPPTSSADYKIALQAVEVRNGTIAFQPAGAHQPTVLTLTDLVGTASSPSAPLQLNAQAALNGTNFALKGLVGPIARFSGVGDGPWPVDLSLNTTGATATLRGAIASPRQGSGYDITVSVAVPALEALNPLLPPGAAPLPPVHDISASARIVDQHSTIPAIDNLLITAGPSDLSSLRPGLALSSLNLAMPSLDKSIALAAAGTISGAPLSLNVTLGAVQALFNPALLPASMPPQGGVTLNLQAQAGPAQLTVTGGIATPVTLAGAALALNASIPNLAALGPLAGTPLPNWRNITIQTTVIDPGGVGLYHGIGLDGLELSMDNAQLGGVISLMRGAQPRLQAALAGQRIDLDALLAALPPPTAPSTTPPAAPVTPPAPPAPPALLPDWRFPLALLKSASADAQLAVTTLIFKHATYTGLQAHAVLANGLLTINPLTGQLPGGSVAAALSLDASKTPAVATARLAAPALALSPFLQALGLPDTAQGTVQARLNLTGSGDSLPEIAATLNGQLGLASVNGIIDGALLNRLFGATLGQIGLPAAVMGAGGPVPFRCFGLAVDASNGVGNIRALTLDSSRLLLQGGGQLNFGPETMALILRPELRVGQTTVGVPVALNGSFSQPATALASPGAVQQAAAAAPGLANPAENSHSLLGQVASAMGIGQTGDVCPFALQSGRLGQPGPSAGPAFTATPGSPTPAATSSGPKSLLNALFGH